MQVSRTFDLLDRYAGELAGKPDALAGRVAGAWVRYSGRRYVETSRQLGLGLLALGLRRGDRVATIDHGRPEWNFVDMGVSQAGLVHVPLALTLADDAYPDILGRVDAKAVFVAGRRHHDLAQSLAPGRVFTFDAVEGAPSWMEVRDLGTAGGRRCSDALEEAQRGVRPGDPATLLFTSGTTGRAKGVALSHGNLVGNATALADAFRMRVDERYLSILPICHVGERLGNYQAQASGCGIYYSDGPASIARDLVEVRPHGLGAVPRIVEQIHDRFVARGLKGGGVTRRLFTWALKLAREYEPSGGEELRYGPGLWLARALVLRHLRAALGGNLRAVGVGGASLSPSVERVFWAAGIRLQNVYGLTETAAVVTVNRPPNLRPGSAGTAIQGVEVRIAADGEILCRGPNVMLGYHDDDEATGRAIDAQGWLHTGDVGRLEDGGFLVVTDRKADLFKLSNGRFVSPQPLEELCKASALVEQALVVGAGERCACVLLVPNREALRLRCEESGIPWDGVESALCTREVEALYQGVVDDANRRLPAEEKLRRFRLVSEEWSPGTGELSFTLKPRRRILRDRYAELIQEMYAR
jgi:long-chain acyl-CoA synthetase